LVYFLLHRIQCARLILSTIGRNLEFASCRGGWGENLLTKQRYGDSLSGRGSNSQPYSWEPDTMALSYRRSLGAFQKQRETKQMKKSKSTGPLQLTQRRSDSWLQGSFQQERIVVQSSIRIARSQLE